MTLGTDNDLAAELVAMAGRTDHPAPGPDLDPGRVAEAVLAEVLGRAALLARPPAQVDIQFEFVTPERTLGYVVSVGPRTDLVTGWTEDPAVRIRQDLAESVRQIYGPAGTPADTTRQVTVRSEPGPTSAAPDDPAALRWQAANIAAGQLVLAFSAHQHDLATLALKFGSDKWGGHWYTPHYERHFGPYRDRAVRVLEIGIGGYQSAALGGASLRMWKHFFRRGLIYGLDIADKSDHDEPRVRTIRGDQSDVSFLIGLNDRYGPFDIVIDDGSHLSAHVIASFTTLFPLLRHGGLYVIEDLETSYWPTWNGGRTSLNDTTTSVGFLKTLVDGLHHQEITEPDLTEFGRDVTGVHFYHNMAVLEKGANRDQAAPAWIRGD
ncbi:hypothetical protein ALI144C_00210 [Actinosynnema sp. ALI-1.44]|uniref:class I SAM-dependent methyltransferase n=1 Tax=Actinosynnema sp. ALI-1.44 TaxID=1933779 RepID=UPI00097C7BE1|nr:class I SAM-dependent methyltransferase [Actinosynnema sp. ALI-1.44]ONI91986.1 hypothetical protein ALI144C_00210 [Actinosynnema sp. ALI-1.44]